MSDDQEHISVQHGAWWQAKDMQGRLPESARVAPVLFRQGYWYVSFWCSAGQIDNKNNFPP